MSRTCRGRRRSSLRAVVLAAGACMQDVHQGPAKRFAVAPRRRRVLAAATYIFCASAIPALAFGEQLSSETGGTLSAVHGAPAPPGSRRCTPALCHQPLCRHRMASHPAHSTPAVLAATALAGVAQALAGGQPLLIVGVAEPTVLVYSYLYQASGRLPVAGSPPAPSHSHAVAQPPSHLPARPPASPRTPPPTRPLASHPPTRPSPCSLPRAGRAWARAASWRSPAGPACGRPR